MCGLVGFTGNIQGKEETIKNMANLIAHRGPDGEGFYLGEDVALGHRRLSIIDLKSGDQPMYNEDKSLVLVFNGEIYNYRELRAALMEKGHDFKTESDSEVLLHGYEEYGRELPKKLRGMFAFVIYDTKNKTIFASRDHFGIKPFYYTEINGELLFGSEIKAFFAHPDFKPEFNEEQLELYLSFRYSPGENSFFKGVKKLPQAHSLFWDGKIEISRYWKPEYSPATGKTLEDWADDTEKIMQDSVKAHKISDVEVGSFLSSGVDSSYISALADVDKTFTVGFDNGRCDETSYAKEFSKTINVNNYSYKIDPDEYWATFSDIQYYMDEPLSDAAGAALYFLNRLAAKQVKVCLSGEGADELFGGYNIYKEPFTVSGYDRLPQWLRSAIGAVASVFPQGKGVNFLVRRGKSLEKRYIGNIYLMDNKQKKALLKNYSGKTSPESLTIPIMREKHNAHPLTRMQYTDMNFWLVGDILLKADKMSMANSLELRVPFLDKEVFALASSIPVCYRANKNETKIALRAAAKKIIPQKVAEKKKLGFPVPVCEWLREEKYASIVRKSFNSEVASRYFKTEELNRLLDEHFSKKKNNWNIIWCVFSFLVWYERYFGEGKK